MPTPSNEVPEDEGRHTAGRRQGGEETWFGEGKWDAAAQRWKKEKNEYLSAHKMAALGLSRF